MTATDQRRLGKTDIWVSQIAIGCWPIAGMTTLGTNEADSLATIRACFNVGINFLDTAYCYGPHGESERLIAKALGNRRDQMVIATKCGIGWDKNIKQVVDGRPATLKQQCEESLRRLGTDRVELLYLHSPDPQTPLADSAGALRELMEAGKTRTVGLSNASIDQLREFAAVCPLSSFQPPYNMLQRNIESTSLPWCRENEVSAFVYWPLMKGLLAGKLARDHVWAVGDGRAKYPMFQGAEWEKNQDFLDELRKVASSADRTVSQVVLNWTIHQPGITAALCGAKRADQIRENAGGMGWRLTGEQTSAIDKALLTRGTAVTRRST